MKPTLEIIEFGRRAVEELDARLSWLQIEWADVNAKRNAWMLILGENETGSIVKADASEQNEIADESQGKDITEMARQIISRSSESGFEPRDVTSRLKKMNIEVGSGFSSNLLFRMKKKGEVVEHNGKYYLPKFDPKPRLNLNASKDQGATEVTP